MLNSLSQASAQTQATARQADTQSPATSRVRRPPVGAAAVGRLDPNSLKAQGHLQSPGSADSINLISSGHYEPTLVSESVMNSIAARVASAVQRGFPDITAEHIAQPIWAQ